MMNNDHTCSVDLVIDIILNSVDEVADANPPTISWENDGIGHYEFWGQKGFDAGNTFPVGEEFLETVRVPMPDFADRMIEHIGRIIVVYGFESFVDVEIDGKYDVTTIRAAYEVGEWSREGKDLLLTLYWAEELEDVT